MISEKLHWVPTAEKYPGHLFMSHKNVSMQHSTLTDNKVTVQLDPQNDQLKVDVPILPCVFYTFNWLTLTSEMYFVRFHPEVTSCLLSRGKTKYATLGMRLWCKYIRNYLLVYQLTSHFLPYLQNYKEFEGNISDLQLEKYGFSFETKKYTTSCWARGVRMWSA